MSRGQSLRRKKNSERQSGKQLIVIDPGHQERGNSAKEPIGPGASQTKAKVTGGATGNVLGIKEYELNLQLSMKLKAELEHRGYSVLMTRETHAVDLSNAQRAQIANEANAAAFIRMHANSSESTKANGAMTICQTASNPYNKELYAPSKALSADILDALVQETGCKRDRLWETDSMSGINWAKVPSTIVEVGYLSNPDEERKLADESYQAKVVTGIANGVDRFFS